MKKITQIINFYGVNATQNVEHAFFNILINLLIKVQEEKKNSLVYSSSLNLLQELDDFLWTNAVWLPHALVTDSFKELQPILLTSELTNYNTSHYLFIIGSLDFKNLPYITKTSIIFNLNDINQMDLFEKKWQELKMYNMILKYFKQDQNGKFQNVIP